MGRVAIAVWLASAYALFLLALAFVLDFLARADLGERLLGRIDARSAPAGRWLARTPGAWPGSEALRFQRGIACCLASLGTLWPLAMMLRRHAPAELGVLGVTASLVALGSLPLWSRLRRTPTGFPEGDAAAQRREADGDD